MTILNLVQSSLRRCAPRLGAVVVLACIVMLPALTAAAQGYSIRPGDTLRIEVIEDPSLNRTVLVAPDGRISVPQAGTLRAAGQTVESVQTNLIQRLRSNFATTPNVFVAIEQLAERRARQTPAVSPTISVYVMGEATKPGKFDVAPGTNVLQMFAMMGGFTKFAADKRIQLRRVDSKSVKETIYQLNYPAMAAGGPGSLTTLMDGDVIVVPQRRLFE